MENCYPHEGFKEEDRFKPYYIHLSELIYGRNFQSPGGEEILKQLIYQNSDHTESAFENGLDIGAGCGGNSIFLCKEFNCAVTAIEINDSFIEIAKERFEEMAAAAQIIVLNKSILDFHESNIYNIAICRDVFMYITDKYNALLNIYNSLKQNGKLILIDYCMSENVISAEFKNYISRGGFDLFSINEYSLLFHSLGFKRVVIKDITEEYVHHIQLSLSSFAKIENELGSFATGDLAYIQKRSSDKIQFCREGSMFWVGIVAEK
jgi:SAM-dependent methyltransferase